MQNLLNFDFKMEINWRLIQPVARNVTMNLHKNFYFISRRKCNESCCIIANVYQVQCVQSLENTTKTLLIMF